MGSRPWDADYVSGGPPPPLRAPRPRATPVPPSSAPPTGPPPPPPSRSPPKDSRDRVRSVEELPPCFQPIFPSFKYFNGIQAEMLDFILSSARSFVVSAPTGSGKTVLLELAIVQMLMKHVDRATGAFNHKPGELKAIYMAPLKALVQEKKEEWIAAFGAIGVVCKELTGDTDIVSWSELNNVDILLTTPEKFDSITRKNKDRGGMSFFGDCALVMIDEVHLLGDERGGSLEAVVSRLKVLSEKPSLRGAPLSSVRFVACSATVPNLDDVGRWLGAPSPDGIRHFGEEYRPVRLETKVLGYDPAKNDWMFERRLNERLYEVVLNHFQSKPALVFCSSRDGASSAAKELAEKARNASRNPFVRDERQRESLREAAGRAENRQLKVVIPQGVAFHSASLDWSDRELCERLFRDRLVTVMCSTSTLSMGVNLPAFLCVVRGTRQYAGQGEYREIERSALLQMCGRAGRPQFDTSGVAVIMTQKHTRVIYDGLVHGTQPIESNLGLAMAEHVNAEIASGIIADSETAMDWLKHSFFYIRVTRNPRHYGIAPGKNPDVACGEIVAENLRKISAAHMCEIGEDAAAPRGNFVRPLEGGRVMSDMYIRFETMKRIMSVQSPASVPDLLMTLCESDELSSIKLRRDEKVLLKGWNLSKDEPAIVRFKVTEIRGKTGKVAVAKTIKTAAQKIYIIAQETMSDQFATVLPPSMRMEVENVFQNGRRIMQGAARYYANVSKKGSFAAYCNALRLAKALDMRMWDDTQFPMRQIPKCGKKSVQALANAGLRSLDEVLAQDPRALERIVNKAFPHGNHLHDAIRSLPCAMILRIERASEIRGGGITATVTFEPEAGAGGGGGEGTDASVTESSRRWTARLIIGTTWNDELLHNERICQRGPAPDNVEAGVPVTRSVSLSSAPPGGQEVTIVATLMFDKCVGRDTDAVLRVRATRTGGGGGGDAQFERRMGAVEGNVANVVSPKGRNRVAAGKENNLSPAFCRLMAAPPVAPKPAPRAIWTEPMIPETATLGSRPVAVSGPSKEPFDAFEDVPEWIPAAAGKRRAPDDNDGGWGGCDDADEDLSWGGADAHHGPPPMCQPPTLIVIEDDDDEDGRGRREPRPDPPKRVRAAAVFAEPSTPVPGDAGFTDPTSGLTLDLLCDDW